MMGNAQPERSDDGVTLIELVVVVMILGIVVTAIFATMNSLTSTERRAQNRVAAQEDIRTALTEMGRDLRSTQRLDVVGSSESGCAAAADCVSFWRADGGHTRWRLDTGTKSLLREQEVPAGSGTWTRLRTYRDIRNGDDGTALLRYYGAGNQQLGSSVTPTDLATCTLRVRLTLRAAPADVTPPYNAMLDVGLRNKGSRGVSGC